MAPQKIMFIRHGEKPERSGVAVGIDQNGNEDKESLTVRGWQRAGALIQFFSQANAVASLRSIARPKHLFAAFADLQGTDDSKRPYETIEPLSAFLTIPIDKSSTKDEIKKLVAKVTAIDDVVLVSWEHRKIPHIGRILVAGSQAIPDWPDERFDMVWVFDRVNASWQFCQVRQLLLHGDRPDGFA